MNESTGSRILEPAAIVSKILREAEYGREVSLKQYDDDDIEKLCSRICHSVNILERIEKKICAIDDVDCQNEKEFKQEKTLENYAYSVFELLFRKLDDRLLARIHQLSSESYEKYNETKSRLHPSPTDVEIKEAISERLKKGRTLRDIKKEYKNAPLGTPKRAFLKTVYLYKAFSDFKTVADGMKLYMESQCHDVRINLLLEGLPARIYKKHDPHLINFENPKDDLKTCAPNRWLDRSYRMVFEKDKLIEDAQRRVKRRVLSREGFYSKDGRLQTDRFKLLLPEEAEALIGKIVEATQKMEDGIRCGKHLSGFNVFCEEKPIGMIVRFVLGKGEDSVWSKMRETLISPGAIVGVIAVCAAIGVHLKWVHNEESEHKLAEAKEAEVQEKGENTEAKKFHKAEFNHPAEVKKAEAATDKGQAQLEEAPIPSREDQPKPTPHATAKPQLRGISPHQNPAKLKTVQAERSKVQTSRTI